MDSITIIIGCSAALLGCAIVMMNPTSIVGPRIIMFGLGVIFGASFGSIK